MTADFNLVSAGTEISFLVKFTESEEDLDKPIIKIVKLEKCCECD